MLDLQRQQASDENGILLTEKQIVEKVLGRRLGYIKGLGFGPRPGSIDSQAREHSQPENDFHEQLHRQEELIQSQQQELRDQWAIGEQRLQKVDLFVQQYKDFTEESHG